VSEHDFEPIRGLPADLPEGEEILWQGAPDARLLAEQAFHIRAVAAYFGLMLLWRAGEGLVSGEAAGTILIRLAGVAPLALAGLAVLAFLAWLNARTTVYTITNRRVVLRFGAAFTKAINLPFTVLEDASLETLPGGGGNLALKLKAPNKIALLMLWPHARPWRLAAPEPTLRAVRDAEAAAQVLSQVMRRPSGAAARPAPPQAQLDLVAGQARAA
jgi:hypothetical protein